MSPTKSWTTRHTLDIVYPAVMQFRNCFYDIIPFKDVKGTWKAEIHLKDDNHVQVIHRKAEQAHDNNPSKYFYFEWKLVLLFDRLHFFDLCDAKLQITKYSFHEHTSDDTKRTVEQAFKRFLPKNEVSTPKTISLSVSEALQCIASTLRRSQTTGQLPVDHPLLPNDYSLLELIKVLDIALGQNTTSLPSLDIAIN